MLRLFFLCTFLVFAGPVLGAEPVPFTASYAVSYRGLSAGLLHFELHEAEPGILVYESRPEPSLLARFLVGADAHERSVMRIDARGIRPLSWYVDDGKSGKKQDGALTFFWEEGVVRGTIKGKPLALPAEAGLQDRFSVQIAVMTALLRGREPGIIPMISDDEIKHYRYTRLGTERIRVPAGEFETVRYESTRPGSSRLSRIWHIPALGYIAARAEQLRNGKVETIMELVAVKREKAVR